MRLSNQLRDTIIQEVVETTTKKEAEALKKREQAFAMQCYNHVFSKTIRDRMEGLPRGFLPEDKCLRFNLLGMNIQLNVSEAVRVPYRVDAGDGELSSYRNGCQRLGNIADEALAEKFKTLHADKEAHKERVNKIARETKALLYSLHTYPQLEKTWPEGKKFYSKYAPKNGESQLPAVLISELNKTLGLAA